ncbi:Rossmann-fold NAD(P)-binding domain-containing protein, partial [Singulisphaera rosea]
GVLHVPFGTGKHAPIAAEDQGRVIAGLLEDPKVHGGKVYPLFGPVEYTYEETAQLLSRILGRAIQYKQVDFDEFSKVLQSSGKSAGRDNTFLFQHLKEVAIDHQNGIFAGTNDLVEKLGGRPPLTLEAFIEKHRAKFV